mmetsp:Transcript_4868/g.7846  ORF Transcript_4868/g.7846 Transcript_4868/m.7846 type:complete len:321 (+) Transcript_4868:92-1054(+)
MGGDKDKKKKDRKKDKKSDKKKDKKTSIRGVYNDKELAETAQAGVIEIAVATFDFDARSEAELSFKKDQYIEILKKTETVGWWKGRLRGTQNTGLFPSNYAKVFYTITEKDAVRTAEGSIKMTPEQQQGFIAAQKKRQGSEDDSSSDGDKITIATVLFDFSARKPEEISISKGDEIVVVEGGARGGWWKGQKANGDVGLFPSNYCQISERDAAEYGGDNKSLKALDKLRSKLNNVDKKFATDPDDSNEAMANDVATLQSQLTTARAAAREKDKQVRILTEKLRIAEEIIENMDTMLKEAQGSHKSKKEKNKYWKRQSSKF